GAGLIARTGVDPALRVDLLHRCHARECPPAAVRGRSEFEPRNVVRPLTGHMGQYFGRHGAAVHVTASGQNSTELAEATRPLMSAMPPIATKAVSRSETSLCARGLNRSRGRALRATGTATR